MFLLILRSIRTNKKNKSILSKLVNDFRAYKKDGSVKNFINSFFTLQAHIQSILFWIILEFSIIHESLVRLISYTYLKEMSKTNFIYEKNKKWVIEDSKYYNWNIIYEMWESTINGSNFEFVKQFVNPYFLKISIIWYNNSIQKYAAFYFEPVVELLFNFFLSITVTVKFFLIKIENFFGIKINLVNFSELKTFYFEKNKESQSDKIKDIISNITYGQKKIDKLIDLEKIYKKNNVWVYNNDIQYLNSTEYTTFLTVFSKENRMVDVTDTLGSLFMSNAWFDFTNPASLEYRGIVELYHFVMLKLLFIFLLLIIISVFLLNRVNLATNSYKLKNLVPNVPTKYLMSFILLFNNGRKKQNLVNNNIKNIFKIKEVIYLLNRSSTVNVTNLFMPVTYWVYFSTLEFMWTLIPCIILLFISIPSFTLALALDETHKPSIWVKVIGNQWYWIYEYSTFDENILIYSNIIYGSDLLYNSLRLLKPDLCITIINNKFTRFLVTSSDVIHSWAVPALGIKIDACPGRINSISILPTKEGVYFGQCSEICGVNHAFMPISVEVVA